MKIKRTMWLIDNRDDSYRGEGNDFQVRKVKNHIFPEIKDLLSETEVNAYIRRGWDVIIEGRK